MSEHNDDDDQLQRFPPFVPTSDTLTEEPDLHVDLNTCVMCRVVSARVQLLPCSDAYCLKCFRDVYDTMPLHQQSVFTCPRCDQVRA
jgi:hypothetical protein